MKKVLLGALCLLFFAQASYSAGYCPTNDEVKLKMQQYQTKAINNIGNNVTLEQIEALNNEIISYQSSLVPNCVQYFQLTHNPDCNRLLTLATGYMLLDKNKQYTAKGQIFNVARPYKDTCPAQYMTIEMFVK